MASLGQLRLSPSGRVIGIGVGAALQIAQARGYDTVTVSELLQEAEAVILPLLNDNGMDENG
ncbi:MAG: hypothetical protein HY370_04140 [Proteobacteria bacterium]|nr:hypothetical protein [Pseudomonadota bacterium]